MRGAWIIVGISLVAMHLAAQSPEPVAAVLAAHGKAWESGQVSSISEGTLTAYGLHGPRTTFGVRLLQQGTTKVQRILTPPKGSAVRQGTDGIRSWYSLPAPFGSSQVPEDVVHFIESYTMRSVQSLLSAREARDVGRTSGSRRIELTTANKTTKYVVDEKTSLVTQLEFTIGQTKDLFGQTIPLRERLVFSDFRRVQGLMTPFRIERYRNNLKVEEMRFTSVAHVSVADEEFRP